MAICRRREFTHRRSAAQKIPTLWRDRNTAACLPFAADA
jgi:hypothetical protein